MSKSRDIGTIASILGTMGCSGPCSEHLKEISTLSTFLNFCQIGSDMALPFIVEGIVLFFGDNSKSIWYGILFASLFTLSKCVQKILQEHTSFSQWLLGYKASIAMKTLIYDKSFKLSPATNKDFN